MRRRFLFAFLVAIIAIGFGSWSFERSLESRYNPNKIGIERDNSLFFPFPAAEASISWQREGYFINLMNSGRRGFDHLLDNEVYGPDGSGRKRVLLIGDSFVYGTGVANPDDMLGQRLEDELNLIVGKNAFDVQTIGLHGASTVEESEWLTDELLSELDPDLIVVGLVPNDTIPSGRESAICGSDRFCAQPITSTDIPEYAACINGKIGFLPRLVRITYMPFFPLISETILSRYCDLGRIASESNTLSYAELIRDPESSPYWKYFLSALDRFASINRDIPVTFSPLYDNYIALPERVLLVNSINDLDLSVSEMPSSDEALRLALDSKNLWVNPVDAHPNRYLNELYAKDIASSLLAKYPWIKDVVVAKDVIKPLVSAYLPLGGFEKASDNLAFAGVLTTDGITSQKRNLQDGTLAAVQKTPCANLGSAHGALYLRSGLPEAQRLELRLLSTSTALGIVDIYTMSVDRNSKSINRKVGEVRPGETVFFNLEVGERSILLAPRVGGACDDPNVELTLLALDIELFLR